jgi:hypothetical protein
MANTNLTIDMITREALRILHNNLGFTRTVNREYQDEFAKSGAKIGTVLRIRKPIQVPVVTGATLSATDYVEEKVDLTVATQKHVDVNFTSAELTMSLDDFSRRILTPAMARLASEIDKDGLAQYVNVAQSVGTPGTTPSTALVWLQANQKLNEMAVPLDSRFGAMNPITNAYMVDGLKGLFHASGSISSQFKKGMMGENVLGFDELFMDQNVQSQTNGAGASYQTNLGSGWTTEGLATLAVDTGTGALTAGQVFTIAGIFDVNPETKVALASLKQFVVTAAYGGGGGNISYAPAIYSASATGSDAAKQNVAQTNTAGNFDNKALTLVGSASTAYPQNLAYHRDAFTLATVDLQMPEGVDMARRATYDGISLRIVRQYDISNDKFPCRIDVLYGWATTRPEFACRVWG